MFGRISAREWNDHIRHLGTRYPLQVKTADAREPDHAWKVTPSYDGVRKKWTATVRAGSVNCRIARIGMTFGRAPEPFQKYLRLANPTRPFADSDRVDVPLDFGPSLDLAWREIGGDAAPLSQSATGAGIQTVYETIPSYFINQGVRQPGQGGEQPLNTRRLFASDIVLRQPRTFLTNEISSLPGGLLGGSILSVNPVSSAPVDSSEPPNVVSTARFVVPAVSNSFADIFFQRFLDEPTDELHLSTVYALSPPRPPGASVPAGPDESFMVRTRYYCHYNLAHATRTLPRVRTPPLTLVTGLAAGLGDVLFNFILSAQNDFAQSTVDLYNQRSLRGSFWAV